MVAARLQILMPWLIQEGVKLVTYAMEKDNGDMLKAFIARGADPNSKTTVGAGVERVYRSVKGGGEAC